MPIVTQISDHKLPRKILNWLSDLSPRKLLILAGVSAAIMFVILYGVISTITKDAEETAIGYIPRPEDIDLTDLDMDRETLKGLLSVDKDIWEKEADEIEVHYRKFGDRLPHELAEQLDTLRANLAKMV